MLGEVKRTISKRIHELKEAGLVQSLIFFLFGFLHFIAHMIYVLIISFFVMLVFETTFINSFFFIFIAYLLYQIGTFIVLCNRKN